MRGGNFKSQNLTLKGDRPKMKKKRFFRKANKITSEAINSVLITSFKTLLLDDFLIDPFRRSERPSILDLTELWFFTTLFILGNPRAFLFSAVEGLAFFQSRIYQKRYFYVGLVPIRSICLKVQSHT